MNQERAKIAERFWPRVDKSGDCWTWSGNLVRPGIVQVVKKAGFSGTNVLAHRLAWQLARDVTLGRSDVIRQTCGNKACVRPDHLELTNKKETIQLPERMGRKRPAGVISREQVVAIKLALPTSRPGLLAKQYGLSMSTVRKIREGKTWTHVVGLGLDLGTDE